MHRDLGVDDMTEASRSYPPRGLNLEASSDYLGIGRTLFLEMVEDGRMPRPKYINSKPVWDRLQIDAAFDELPQTGKTDKTNPWDSL